MKPIKLLIILTLLTIGTLTERAQTTPIASGALPSPTPTTVSVSTNFVDDATKAFQLVRAQRDALDKAFAQISASDVTKAALREQIQALNDVIAIKDRKELAYEEMAKLWEKISAIKDGIIDRMAKELSKPKSGWQKVLAVLTRLGDIALGVAVGRVL